MAVNLCLQLLETQSLSQWGKDSSVVVNTCLVITATFLELDVSNGFRKSDLQPSAGLRHNKGLNVLEMERFVERNFVKMRYSVRNYALRKLLMHLKKTPERKKVL